MSQQDIRQLAQKVISKEKWWDILSRFIDVLRINIFIVDVDGLMILPPEEGRCGGRLLLDKSLGFDFFKGSSGLMKQFQKQGNFLESVNRYDLHSFAIPINVGANQTIAYMVIGPVVLNRRKLTEEYESLAHQYSVDVNDLIDEINELRVVSNVMMNSILELLSGIVRDNVQLSMKEKELHQIKFGQDEITQQIKKVADEIDSTVRLNELLVTLLDVALKMTETDTGSIMVVDQTNGELVIKVSKGLKDAKLYQARLKAGEGIAGAAVLENSTFVINGQKSDNNRIKNLLKRSDIKQSLVMPINAKDRVFGVLNLSSKNEGSKIQENLDNLQYLTRLLESAV